MCRHSEHRYPENLVSNFQQDFGITPADCPALSGYGLNFTMVTLLPWLLFPNVAVTVPSPWLLINPPSVDLLSLGNIALQAGRPYNLSAPSLLDSVQWVGLFQESDWSNTRSKCA